VPAAGQPDAEGARGGPVQRLAAPPKFFLGPRTVLGAVRGRPHSIDGRDVWATYHPSAAIRFGPNGAPRAALLADLTDVARSVR
jgi:uracil-DNA glycosylase